jgi:anti-sigma factor RsiW
MKYEDSHLSDEELVLDVDGELSATGAKQVRIHLDACWKCRARRQELEGAIANFVRIHQQELDSQLPSGVGPRALLKAQLERLSAIEPHRQNRWSEVLRKPGWRIAATAILLLGLFLSRAGRHNLLRQQAIVVSMPDARLTPGAASVTSRQAVCALANVKNKEVRAALQSRVFEEYGIVKAEPRAYEIDYLVTPALGGSDDIRNLWPHSYLATAWNAHVKDNLEDRLREMVCDGTLDLTEAQREISVNWIAAYKKYFHTERPLPSK